MKSAKGTAAKYAILIAVLIVGLASCDIAGFSGTAGDLNGLGENGASDRNLPSSGKLLPNSILVEFDPCGGTVEPGFIIAKHGPTYGELPMPSRDGYTFEGWWTEPEGKGTPVTSTTKVVAKSGHTLFAQWHRILEKIVGTAAIGSTSFFFEFGVSGAETDAHSSVPVSPDGYVRDGIVVYEEVEYETASLYFDHKTGYMAGTTKANDGISFAFEGVYSQAEGFVGSITKTENGATLSGIMVGTPVFPNTNVVHYVGAATYLFPTPTPQTLIFNAVINLDTNEVVGTWCESGEGWGYSIHGTVGGTLHGESISISAALLPAFRPYLLYDLSVTGEGTFDNDSRETISGNFEINYGGMILPSLLAATKAPD